MAGRLWAALNKQVWRLSHKHYPCQDIQQVLLCNTVQPPRMAANYKQYWNILDRFDRFMTQQKWTSDLMIEIDRDLRDLFTFFNPWHPMATSPKPKALMLVMVSGWEWPRTPRRRSRHSYDGARAKWGLASQQSWDMLRLFASKIPSVK